MADWLESMLPPGRPRRLSEMMSSGARKYQDIKGGNFSQTMIEAHVSGRATYAATLDCDGLARLGIIDRDEGAKRY